MARPCDVCLARPGRQLCVCERRWYCSKRCQETDWTAKLHFEDCERLGRQRPAGDAEAAAWAKAVGSEDVADAQVGDRVRIVGLVSATAYNGREGIVEAREEERWRVRLRGGRALATKNANLRPARRCASVSCRMPQAQLACVRKCGRAFYCGRRCRLDDRWRHKSRCFPIATTEPAREFEALDAAFREEAEAYELSWRPRTDTCGPGLDRLRFAKRVDDVVAKWPSLAAARHDGKSHVDIMCEGRKLEAEAEIKGTFFDKRDDLVPCPLCRENADDAGTRRGLCFWCGQSVCAACAVDVEIACPPTGVQVKDEAAYEDEYPFARKCPRCSRRFMPRCSELEHVSRMESLVREKPQGRYTPFVLKCLGDIYLEGCDGLFPDEVSAEEFYERAFEAGSMESAVCRGKVAWRRGDRLTAKTWFQRAVEQGNYSPAKVQLAMLFVDSGYGLGHKDEAVDLLKQALRDTNELGAFDTLRKMGVEPVGILVGDDGGRTAGGGVLESKGGEDPGPAPLPSVD